MASHLEGTDGSIAHAFNSSLNNHSNNNKNTALQQRTCVLQVQGWWAVQGVVWFKRSRPEPFTHSVHAAGQVCTRVCGLRHGTFSPSSPQAGQSHAQHAQQAQQAALTSIDSRSSRSCTESTSSREAIRKRSTAGAGRRTMGGGGRGSG